MTNIGDHPLIARTLETGYPEEERFILCADCGGEFYGSDKMYNIDGDWVCPDCTRERILEAYDTADLAAAFGICSRTAYEIWEVI